MSPKQTPEQMPHADPAVESPKLAAEGKEANEEYQIPEMYVLPMRPTSTTNPDEIKRYKQCEAAYKRATPVLRKVESWLKLEEPSYSAYIEGEGDPGPGAFLQGKFEGTSLEIIVYEPVAGEQVLGLWTSKGSRLMRMTVGQDQPRHQLAALVRAAIDIKTGPEKETREFFAPADMEELDAYLDEQEK